MTEGPRSTFGLRDLLDEAYAGVLTRPARSILTALGTVLGVATVVAILGLTTTTSAQVSAQFSVLRATEVTVNDGRDSTLTPDPAPVFQTNAEDQARRLNGVTAAGTSWLISQSTKVTSALNAGAPSADVDLHAASAGLGRAVDAIMASGRWWDSYAESDALPVAVIGEAIAQRLNITDLTRRPAVFIDGEGFTVIGILRSSRRLPALALSVTVPRATALLRWPVPVGQDGESMLVTTRVGAAGQVAHELPLALRPDAPELLSVIPPPDPQHLARAVGDQLRSLLLLLSGICLLVGAVGIANTTLVAVMERTPEIGLRRAIGARRRHVAAQFLAESGILGFLGGLIGTTVGIGTVVLVSLARHWTAVIPQGVVVAAPAAGLAIGLIAGLYPAMRAARIEPVEALRR